MIKTTFLVFFLISISCWSQTGQAFDFITADANVEIFPTEGRIAGEVLYTVDILSRTDSVVLDARHMAFSRVTVNKKPAFYSNSGKQIVIRSSFKPGRTYEILISYEAIPEEAVYFLGWNDNRDSRKQIWTQGQGKYTSHWLPSIDDMNEKVIFDLQITFDKPYTVVANGELLERLDKGSKTTWRFNMDQPMSSYLAAFAIGNFSHIQDTTASGIQIFNYYSSGDSLKVEPTYRYTTRIMEFLNKEIGIPYPWKNYKQVPVRDFLYAGMENTGLTIFSDQFVIDSLAFIDKNYVNVNAHEMAHQWFGNLITEESSKDHWLHEGFATYYALKAEEKVFGTEYYSWQLYNKAIMLQSLSEEGEGEALTDPDASSITFYDKGAWAVAILRSQLGDANFKSGIRQFLKKFAYKNVTIEDFLDSMESVSGTSLEGFKEIWLHDDEFPFADAIAYLEKINPEFIQLSKFKNTPELQQGEVMTALWDMGISTYFKSHLIRNFTGLVPDGLQKRILSESDTKVRQALILNTPEISSGIKKAFEIALKDPSYITREYAFFRLWAAYPEQRKEYLDVMKGVQGMPDRNIESLWLLLASLTEAYSPINERMVYLDRLRAFTGPTYATDTRQRAFTLIEQAGLWSDKNLGDLIVSTNHHQWQFRQWSRKLLDRLWKDDLLRERLLQTSKKLKDKDLRYLSRKTSTP